MANPIQYRLSKKTRLVVFLAGMVVLFYLLLAFLKLSDLISRDEQVLSDSTFAAAVLFPEDKYPAFAGDDLLPEASDVNKPKICLIIDDFGNNWSTPVVQELLEFPVQITIAVIPGLWASDSIAIKANAEGKEVIVHLPMEPVRKISNRENLFLSSSMDEEEFEGFMAAGFQLPYAIGLNNHMGSLATQDKELMARLARWCSRHDWYVLDSITHPKTKMYQAAQEELVPGLKRDIFLDHDRDQESVERALDQAIRVAKKRKGRPVIVIGHPRKSTFQVLQNKVPGLLKEGIEFVSLSHAIQLGLD